MKLFFVCFFLFVSCSSKNSMTVSLDQFDKIMAIMKTKSAMELIRYYGEPDIVDSSKEEKNIQILRYKNARISAYVDKSKNNKITRLTLFFWEDFDNYAYLKKRFKNYKWLESKLPDAPKSDALTELYLVSVPEAGMEFQYDNYAPKRKVMWIHFD